MITHSSLHDLTFYTKFAKYRQTVDQCALASLSWTLKLYASGQYNELDSLVDIIT